MSAQTAAVALPTAADEPTPPLLKRRRVAKACRNCRAQKSKCDGQHPVCSRCKGYGHICTWPENKKDRVRSLDGPSPTGVLSDSPQSPTNISFSLLHSAIQSYDKLIRNVWPDLPESARTPVDSAVSQIRRRLPPGLVSHTPPSGTPAAATYPRPMSVDCSTNVQRYLGEASDVRFFHTIKKIFRNEGQSGSTTENDTQSYDQGALYLEIRDGRESLADLPTKKMADAYIDIYFFTIHIAYPFINKPFFMERYEKFWNGDVEVAESASWLPLLYTIFAIGAYYTSFPRCENADLKAHLHYFGQAISLSNHMMTDCTLDNIQMLLVQCFFLLAMGQTDRCWNTLGLAIRVAQSIGFHVQDSLKLPLMGLTTLEQETIRRTWYAMYVLDRLLALQLGRPVAIHEEEYCVNLPSETEETERLFEGEPHRVPPDKRPSSVSYSVCVIKFSKILGQVISDLYRPSQVAIEPDRMLLSTTTLDERLTKWKLNLPRHLRFDLGHTFEKSMVFKRQRNMLAIKYHHLRTLMHRPYLCLAWLQQNNRPLMALLERTYGNVDTLERICIHEAQQTAHLLHNVTDERSLVHDFPWWQMISCLLCASSVLLVARACIEPNQADLIVQSQALDEDAETCLKVFDALSVNSDAARRARDMMRDLKSTRILPRKSLNSRTDSSLVYEGSNGKTSDSLLMERLSGESPIQTSNYGVRHNVIEWQTWPGELSDPIAWSAQFLDPSQNFGFNTVPISSTEIPPYTQIDGIIESPKLG